MNVRRRAKKLNGELAKECSYFSVSCPSRSKETLVRRRISSSCTACSLLLIPRLPRLLIRITVVGMQVDSLDIRLIGPRTQIQEKMHSFGYRRCMN